MLSEDRRGNLFSNPGTTLFY